MEFKDCVREVLALAIKIDKAEGDTLALKCLSDNLFTAVNAASDGVLSWSELFVLLAEAEHGGPVVLDGEGKA